MGKRLIQQRRGRGKGVYKRPSHKFKGRAKHGIASASGMITGFVKCPAHTAPLVQIMYDNGEIALTIAPEGIRIGDSVNVESSAGAVLALKDIPEGSLIHNIETRPGDGGKLVRSSGTFAKVITKGEKGVTIRLPSRKERIFIPECRASIGTVAGGGRTEKPFLKAGTVYHKKKMKNQLYPHVSGISMNSVDHPFGGSSSHHKGKPTVAPHNAPPGRKVGKLRPRRTGRRKR